MQGLIGLIVNPVAGIGGRVGLHGTDGGPRYAEAIRRGGTAVSPPRAVRALQRVRLPRSWQILAAPGVMGADLAAGCGLAVTALPMSLSAGGRTTAADTVAAARLLAQAGADLLVFAGGDGTARDIASVLPPGLPVVGIPAGVKMRSGVFGLSPEAAGEVVSEFALGGGRPLADAEILDATADELRTEFYAVVAVPGRTGRLAGPKTFATAGSQAELDALCAATAAEVEPGILYLFGPGSTTGRVLGRLGLRGTALGVDAVRDGQLTGADLSEQQILALMARAPATRLVLGVIGGQGFLLGRGNQQLGPAVLSRLRPADLIIIATAAKLAALKPPRLLGESNEPPGNAR